ncbi:sperm flagellar protein 1-like [Liolophura sinensis]|uniref:sperm flagellar protein 1-like n=1 Tax=Liolophura sinensis TaxID=3198878 RepID=UPI003157FDBC
MNELDDAELEDLYAWIDQIPLSRPKRNIARDFSDGVLIAEVIRHYMPKLVELHNYTPANASKQKMENWYLLNRKVFCKLHFELTDDVIRSICRCEPNIIERVLYMLRVKIDRALWEASKNRSRRNSLSNEKPEVDQEYNSPRRGPNDFTVKRPGPSQGVKGAGAVVTQTDYVPRAVYEEKEQECLAKEETIQILQAQNPPIRAFASFKRHSN